MTVAVSVIIPCYGQGEFLQENINSLTRQTLTSWEAVVVDDGSPDDTERVASSLMAADVRVRYLKKANGGLSSARNAGLHVASGEFIQFLDADDWIDPRKLELHASFLMQRPSIDVVFGNAWYFFDRDPTRYVRAGHAPWWGQGENWIRRRARDPVSIERKMLRRSQFPVCAPLMRKSLVDSVGGFNESMTRLEDWEYWLRCAVCGARFEYLEAPNTNARIRMHASNMSTDKWRMIRAEFDLAMIALDYMQDPELRRLAFQMAARGLEAFDGADWQRFYDLALARAADPVAARGLRIYAALCSSLSPHSLLRRLAHRIAGALA